MSKRLILVLFSACAMAGMHNLQGMKPKVDWNKELFSAIDKADLESMSNSLENGADVNKVGENKETPLCHAIRLLVGEWERSIGPNKSERISFDKGSSIDYFDGSNCSISYIYKSRENIYNRRRKIHNVPEDIEKNGRKLDEFINIIRKLLVHGASIDAGSVKIARDFVSKNQNDFWAILLDRYMKIASEYAKRKDSDSKFKFVSDIFDRERGSLSYNFEKEKEGQHSAVQCIAGVEPKVGASEDIFLAHLCFGKSIHEVNVDKSKQIEDTAFYKLLANEVKSFTDNTYILLLEEFKGGGKDDIRNYIVDRAKELGFYLRPNFFNPVKTPVKTVVKKVEPKISVKTSVVTTKKPAPKIPENKPVPAPVIKKNVIEM